MSKKSTLAGLALALAGLSVAPLARATDAPITPTDSKQKNPCSPKKSTNPCAPVKKKGS